MKQISKHVYVETGIFACNLGVISTTEGNVLIDAPHFATDAVAWRDRVLGLGDAKYAIVTEGHPDHTECACYLPGLLITHLNTRNQLKNLPVDVVLKRQNHLNPEGEYLRKDFQVRLADITFTDTLTLNLGGLQVELFHTPGHSTGNIGVYIPEDKVVFASDSVFHHRKSWLHESDPAQWIESLERMSALDVEIVVPGHGDICSKAYLEEQANIIKSWIGVVQKAIGNGLLLEEAKKTIVSPDPYPKQANTPSTVEDLNDAIITRLYSLYSK